MANNKKQKMTQYERETIKKEERQHKAEKKRKQKREKDLENMGRIQRFFYAEENQGKINVAKGVLGWIVVTIASYLYWALLLLMASLFLLNVWHVTWTQINHYSLILMCITSVVYLIWSYRKKKRG